MKSDVSMLRCVNNVKFNCTSRTNKDILLILISNAGSFGEMKIVVIAI